jgi:hypothetical protein
MGSGICRELLSMWCLELRTNALQRGIDGSSKRGPAMRAEEEGQKQDMERRKREGKRRDEKRVQTHSLLNSKEKANFAQHCDM